MTFQVHENMLTFSNQKLQINATVRYPFATVCDDSPSMHGGLQHGQVDTQPSSPWKPTHPYGG